MACFVMAAGAPQQASLASSSSSVSSAASPQRFGRPPFGPASAGKGGEAEKGDLFEGEPRSPAPPPPIALVGVFLIVTGVGGILMYIASALPLAVQLFSTMTGLGIFLVVREVGLNDPLVCGLTLSDIIALMIRLYQAWICQFMLLASIPGVTGGDVNVVVQGLLPAEESKENEDNEPSGSSSSRSRIKSSSPNSSTASTEASESPAEHRRLLISDGGFSIARQWLERQDLSVSLSDQLKLYGLYRRSLVDDFSKELENSSHEADSWLTKAKFESEKACAGISQAMARAHLAPALAHADPLFAIAEPDFAVPMHGDHRGIFLSLFERRLPHHLPETLAASRRRTLLTSAFVAVLAAFRAGRLRSAGRRSLFWRILSALAAASGAYSLALLEGLPIELHSAVARVCRTSLHLHGPASEGDPFAARLQRYLMLLFAPRVRRSLFAQ